MRNETAGDRKRYQAPVVEEIGALADLTLGGRGRGRRKGKGKRKGKRKGKGGMHMGS